MGVQVTFNYPQFIARYPEFNWVQQAKLDMYFDQAGLYHRNDGTGPVKKETSQQLLMQMVVAHLTQLSEPQPNIPQTGQDVGNPQLVGAINSASEGSVSVSVTNDFPPGTPQWWQQTKYGAQYWAATAGYRTGRYIVKMGRPMEPYVPGMGVIWRI